MTLTTVPCKAKDKNNCAYHLNLTKADTALAAGDFEGYAKAMRKAEKAAYKTGELAEFFGEDRKTFAKNRKHTTPEGFANLTAAAVVVANRRAARAATMEQLAFDSKAAKIGHIETAHDTLPDRLDAAFAQTHTYEVGGDRGGAVVTEARTMYQAAADALIQNAQPNGIDDQGQTVYAINWEGMDRTLHAAYEAQHRNTSTDNMMHSGRMHVNNAFHHTVKLMQQHSDNDTDLAAPLRDLDTAFWETPYAAQTEESNRQLKKRSRGW